MGKISARQQDILKILQQVGNETISGIALALNVSEETIRRDTKFLAAQGEIVKQHGSVSLPTIKTEAPYEKRMRENYSAKMAIAEYAASLINDGDSIIFEAGTTTAVLASHLRTKRNLTVITNSSDIARMLAVIDGNQVYLAGGLINKNNSASFGAKAIEFISHFRTKFGFFSVAAVDAKNGLMDPSLSEAEIARIAMENSEHSICIVDNSKFTATSLVKVSDFTAFHRLIADEAPPPELAAALQQAGVILNVVSA